MIEKDVGTLVTQLVLSAQSTTKDSIRAEGDFHKDIYIVERTNKAGIRPEEQSEKTESSLCLLYTSPSPRDMTISRMPSSA